MRFEVVLTSRAQRDIADILDYVGSQSAAGASVWAARFDECLRRLSIGADSMPLAPEDIEHPDALYHFVFRTRRGRAYRAIFTIRDQVVYITHVRGPGQDFVDGSR